MAAFGTLTLKFGPLYLALCKASGFTQYLNQNVDKSVLVGGQMTARITTAVTVGSITDGTVAPNDAARTNVTLVIFHGTHTPSLFPWETGQFTEDDLLKEVIAFQDAMRYKAEGSVIAQLVAGTAGSAQTIAAGTMDFSKYTTDALMYTGMSMFNAGLAYVEANTQGKGGGICIIMATAAYANFLSMRLRGQFKSDFEREMIPDVLNPDIRKPRWTYCGYPVFVTPYSTSFGGASAKCCFILHRDAEALVFNDIYFPENDNGAQLHHYGDYMQKAMMAGWGYSGLIQASHYASFVNGTS